MWVECHEKQEIVLKSVSLVQDVFVAGVVENRSSVVEFEQVGFSVMIQEEKYERMTVDEFRDSGFLWFTNRILHMFGVGLVYEFDRELGTNVMYPAKGTFPVYGEYIEKIGGEAVVNYIRSDAVLSEEKE